jgi:hypothetical protein
MKSTAINTTERSLVILRIVIIYLILILCTFIPVYYLLDLPEKWTQGTGIKGAPVNKENVDFTRYMVKVDSLQKYLDKNDFGTYYSYWQVKLTEFSKDSVKQDFLYRPLFIKITELYGSLKQFKEYAEYKTKYDDLKTDYEKQDQKLTQTEKDLMDCLKQK